MAEPKLSQALGADDYRQLFSMLTSGDEGQRKQAQQLAGKLTASEAQEFFDFQHAAHPSDELHREDNSFLGVPPEMAVVTGLGIGGSMIKAGAAGASKIAAGGNAVAAAAAPQIKYEMTKSALEAFGVPGPLAAVVAMGVSSYKGGSKEVPASVSARARETLSKTPDEIVDSILGPKPTAAASIPTTSVKAPIRTREDLAAELARRLGTKSEDEVAADMLGRYQKGQKSLAGYAKK